VRGYWRLFVAGIRRQSSYLAATLGGLVANVTFGLLKASVLLAAVAASGGSLASYNAAQMSAYVWISQGLLGSVNLSGRSEFAERVKSGDVTSDFLRPVDVQVAVLVNELGKGVFAFLPRGVPTVAIGLFTLEMAYPTSFTMLSLGAASLVVGLVLSYGCAFLVGVAGFWLVETRGIAVLYMALSGFLSGLYVPIWVFPEWLQHVAQATPFPSIMMTPTDILSTRVVGMEALTLFAIQLFWLGVVTAGGAMLIRAGRRKLEVQGG
jgi:ABC-2 type transport system permease protein